MAVIKITITKGSKFRAPRSDRTQIAAPPNAEMHVTCKNSVLFTVIKPVVNLLHFEIQFVPIIVIVIVTATVLPTVDFHHTVLTQKY